MNKKIFIVVFIVLIALISTISLWLYEGKYFIGRASTAQQDFSLDNSYVFIAPLSAAANGQERIRVTVFILDSQGLGLQGRLVSLSSSPNLTVQVVQSTTDIYGKAAFDISSNQKGEYYLNVNVDYKHLPQQVHLSYY